MTGQRKLIALIAHDHQKQALLEWVRFIRGTLLQHELYATGTAGRILEKKLGFTVTIFESSPMGGDRQIGARIAEG